MINNSPNRELSRSVSQNDHSEQSLTYLRDQSSCSSLTSGIGHSDQSICNDRVSTMDHDLGRCGDLPAANHQNNESQLVSCEKSTTTKPIFPQYLRAPPKKESSTSSLGSSLPSSSSLSSQSNLGIKNDSTEAHTNQEVRDKLRANIKQFVDIIFTDSQSISLEKKAEFGQLMRTHEARLLFAMFVDDYRVNSKRVSELTFYSLAQYFSIILLECLLAEDFRPAKIIMNMMFTYYYEQNIDKIPPRERSLVLSQDCNITVNSFESSDGGDDHHHHQNNCNSDNSKARSEPKTAKTYLYNLLKDQEIFKSIRFWTSAFYESVIIERNNHPVFVDKLRDKLNAEKREEELDCSKNITFGLLGSFIHNMCLLDLSHEFCQEFLNKHSTIAGLSDYQLEMLRSNLESMFRENSDKAPISQASAGERLSMFLQKWSTRLNQSNSSSSSQAQQHPR